MHQRSSRTVPCGVVLADEDYVFIAAGAMRMPGASPLSAHTLHLVAMARAAGVIVNWDDFGDLSEVVPLLARVYPNGSGDVNQFQRAGGMPELHALMPTLSVLLRRGFKVAVVIDGACRAPRASCLRQFTSRPRRCAVA